MHRYQTSESVLPGHPDKICDRIADSVLDDILRQYPLSRVACEVTCTTGMVHVFGEISTEGYCHVQEVVRDTLASLGYLDDVGLLAGFSADSCGVTVSLDRQSPDINEAVSGSQEWREGSKDDRDLRGAGDQGIVFGHACNESELVKPDTRMPLAHFLASSLAEKINALRIDGWNQRPEYPDIFPDGKCQVTVDWGHDNGPVVSNIIISVQHGEGVDQLRLRNKLYEEAIRKVIPARMMKGTTRFFLNPGGRFVKGGPAADSGLTGRKLQVDTYGGACPHGGGAFSGKDPSKVDRSGAYYARYVAKHLVTAEAADEITVQVAYAIGRAYPVNITVDSPRFKPGMREKVERLLTSGKVFDFRPTAMIEELDLLNVTYSRTSAFGHFRSVKPAFPWERIHQGTIDEIKDALKL